MLKEVMLGDLQLHEAAAALTREGAREGARRYAYEMAVGVCDADGRASTGERAFLNELARPLGLPAGEAEAPLALADELADAPFADTAATPAVEPNSPSGSLTPAAPMAPAAPQPPSPTG